MKVLNNKKIIIILLFIGIIFLTILVRYTLVSTERFTSYQKLEYSDKLSMDDIKNLKKGQSIMTKMFSEFDRICRKYNLKYFCIGGTLIGVLRHKGWVPWDGDIDVAMLESDYDKFRQIINKELPPNIKFSHLPPDKPCSKLISTDAKYIYTNWGNNWDVNKGVQLDIFIYKKNNNMIIPYPMEKDDTKVRNINVVYPLKEDKFENITVYIPNKYKEYSRDAWGDYPPPIIDVNKRYPHEGNIRLNF